MKRQIVELYYDETCPLNLDLIYIILELGGIMGNHWWIVYNPMPYLPGRASHLAMLLDRQRGANAGV